MALLYSERSLNFDGSNDRIDFGSISEVNFDSNNTFTACGWFKTSSSSIMTLMGNLEGASNFRGWEIQFVSGQVRFQLISVNTSNEIILDTDDTFNDGEC